MDYEYRGEAVMTSALALPPAERMALAEKLLESLDQEANAVDQEWVREAEDRLAAFRRGELTSVSFEDVMKELRSDKAL